MSIITLGARRRGAAGLPPARESAPWGADVLCQIHDSYGDAPKGSGLVSTIHPSVVDMGAAWNGYRWWMANTPYPNQGESLENPTIYGSNDRINWYPPPGLVNPIDPFPGEGGTREYNSDTELAWDPDGQRLVCYYRHYVEGLRTLIHARWSADGSTWSDEVTLITLEDVDLHIHDRSPAVVRVSATDWRLYMLSRSPNAGVKQWNATGPLGPFTEGETVGAGRRLDHGDIIRYQPNLWLAIGSKSGLGWSPDGVDWHWSPTPLPSGGDVPGTLYRGTLEASTKPGWIDVWYGITDRSLPGTTQTAYTRLPLSVFTAT